MNDKLLLLINGWAGKNGLLDSLMVFCAKDLIYLVFLAAAVCLGYLAYRRQWREAGYAAATLVVTFLLLEVAAHVYVDHRPFVDHHLTQLVSHAAGKSFPSDHATASTAVALGLLVFTRFKLVGWLSLLAALLIGFARVFVGVHYPVDILGGLVTALAGTGVVWAARRVIDGRQGGESHEAAHPVATGAAAETAGAADEVGAGTKASTRTTARPGVDIIAGTSGARDSDRRHRP